MASWFVALRLVATPAPSLVPLDLIDRRRLHRQAGLFASSEARGIRFRGESGAHRPVVFGARASGSTFDHRREDQPDPRHGGRRSRYPKVALAIAWRVRAGADSHWHRSARGRRSALLALYGAVTQGTSVQRITGTAIDPLPIRSRPAGSTRPVTLPGRRHPLPEMPQHRRRHLWSPRLDSFIGRLVARRGCRAENGF